MQHEHITFDPISKLAHVPIKNDRHSTRQRTIHFPWPNTFHFYFRRGSDLCDEYLAQLRIRLE
jgi:hypothetical protein